MVDAGVQVMEGKEKKGDEGGREERKREEKTSRDIPAHICK